MNERDSEIMAQSLLQSGYTACSSMEQSDIVILNTCSIRAKAEQKVLSLLGMLKREKLKRPNLKICVAGCVAQQEGEKLLARMPYIDLIFGTQHIYNLPELLKNTKNVRGVVTSLSSEYVIPPYVSEVHSGSNLKQFAATPNPFRKFVTIMQGCNNFCSYCVVPYTRGREISRKKEDIIDEVKALVDIGVKEITLLGQNVNSYGLAPSSAVPLPSVSFPSLLTDIARIKGLKRIRFTTSHPKDLSEALMRCFQEIEILCHQIHLPVQAGSDSVLQRMNRKYTIAEYLTKIEKLRMYCPDIAITTDIIVGFPGETESDFQQTLNVLEHVQYDGSFSFKYSDRPGTKSTLLPEKVSESVKAERLIRFQSRQDAISLVKNMAFIDKIIPVMVESVVFGGFQGRSEYNHVVHVASNADITPGDVFPVRIIHAGQHSLQGTTL